MSRAFFFAHYTAWALIWGHVLFYYAMFARQAWRAEGGRWRDIPMQTLQLLHFTFVPLAADCWAVARRRPLPEDILESNYSKAHRMAFYIAIAAVTYTIMGLSFSMWPDRSQWPMTFQVLSMMLVTWTSFAGLGHLFTALEHRPRAWRWFVASILAWYPLSIAVFNLLMV